MDLATFRQALLRCGVTQALARNSVIAQGFTDMEVFARHLANDRSVVDFVRSVNKLPAAPDGERPSIPFASISIFKRCAIGRLNVSVVDYLSFTMT